VDLFADAHQSQDHGSEEQRHFPYTCEARFNEDGARSAPTNRISRFVRFSALLDSPPATEGSGFR
jgi:hypothetical protein